MLRVVTPAAAAPVSLAEAKAHLRVDHGDDDLLITSLIDAATLSAQSLVQRLFVEQTVEWVLPDWQCGCIDLPIAPVAKDDVESIKYVDYSGVQQTLDPSQYVVQTNGPTVRIVPAYGAIWPLAFPWAPEPVVIRFDAGDAVEDIPANVKAAIKLTLGHLYENRESVIVGARAAAVEVVQGAQALLLSEIWNA